MARHRKIEVETVKSYNTGRMIPAARKPMPVGKKSPKKKAAKPRADGKRVISMQEYYRRNPHLKSTAIQPWTPPSRSRRGDGKRVITADEYFRRHPELKAAAKASKSKSKESPTKCLIDKKGILVQPNPWNVHQQYLPKEYFLSGKRVTKDALKRTYAQIKKTHRTHDARVRFSCKRVRTMGRDVARAYDDATAGYRSTRTNSTATCTRARLMLWKIAKKKIRKLKPFNGSIVEFPQSATSWRSVMRIMLQEFIQSSRDFARVLNIGVKFSPNATQTEAVTFQALTCRYNAQKLTALFAKNPVWFNSHVWKFERSQQDVPKIDVGTLTPVDYMMGICAIAICRFITMAYISDVDKSKHCRKIGQCIFGIYAANGMLRNFPKLF